MFSRSAKLQDVSAASSEPGGAAAEAMMVDMTPLCGSHGSKTCRLNYAVQAGTRTFGKSTVDFKPKLRLKTARTRLCESGFWCISPARATAERLGQLRLTGGAARSPSGLNESNIAAGCKLRTVRP